MKPRLTSRRPPAVSAAMTRRHASALVASGFSHRTGLPASMQASTNSSWLGSNEATTTASTAGSAISAWGSAITPAPSASRAAAPARAASTSETAATCAPSTRFVSVRTWSAPIIPAPITPTPMLMSHRRREVHVAAVARGVGRVLGPAGRDHLAARVELHALGAVDVRVAEQRRLPAPEGVEGHRHRDRDVDADHPDLHLSLEPPRGLPAGGEDRRAVGVGVRVDQLDRVGQGLDSHHAQHRPEDLVAVDVHLGPHAVEQRRADEETAALEVERATVDD